MQHVRYVTYEACSAIFTLESADAISHLMPYVEQNVHEAKEILKAISVSSSFTVEVTSDYFGYIVIDLIKSGKGHAYCKTCKANYDACQLTSVPLGFGKSPFSINIKPEKGSSSGSLERKG